MYFDALSFLEDEREGWAPFEALLDLPDAVLGRPTDPEGPGHGWSGRDLMVHLVAWQEQALAVARELAVNEGSPTRDRLAADWEARGADPINAEIDAAFASVPTDEVRNRFRTVAGELRGHLTVVPEARWVKNPRNLEFFLENTMDHYEEHRPELAAVLELASAPGADAASDATGGAVAERPGPAAG